MSIRSQGFLSFLAFLAALLALPGASSAVEWTPAKQITPRGHQIHSFASDIGPHNFTVLAWTEPIGDGDAEPEDYRALLFSKARLPGKKKFGPKEPIAVVGRGSTNVDIGAGGLAVMTWPSPTGRLKVSERTAGTAWSDPIGIGTRKVLGASVDVGPDGTVALFDARSRSIGDPHARAVVAVRNPETGTYTSWMRVDDGADTVGFGGKVVAGTDGRATAVWVGPCEGPGAPRNSSYVDVRGNSVTEPATIGSSSCSPWDFDLQMDRAGRQYFRFGGSSHEWNGVKLSIRKPGEPFPRMEFVSPRGTHTNGGDLAVSADGHVTVVWTTYTPGGMPRGVGYASAPPGGFPGKARELPNIRIDVERRRDLLTDVAALPGGRLTMLWKESWTDEEGNWRGKLGIRNWTPGSPFERLEYQYPNAKHLLAHPAWVDAADDGSRMAMWGKENNRAHNLGINWIHPAGGRTGGRG